ncbi:MAG: CinA family protein [Acutalibacteraceae bacterium]
MKIITENDFLQELANTGIEFNSINIRLVNALQQQNLKIATAESCTGGMISQKITDVSGASNVFDYGICSYANHIKTNILGVEKSTLEKLGAVSPDVAVQMAVGVKNLGKSYIGLSTTGIAGPNGGTAEKPVGLVYIGLATPEKEYAIKTLLSKDIENNRNRIRQLATAVAMYSAYKIITT